MNDGPTPAAATSAAPTLSQAEAARACNVSTATIRRARESGRIEGERNPAGDGWQISVASLIASGLMPRTTPPDTVSPRDTTRDTTPRPDTPATPAPTPALAVGPAEVEQLRQQLQEAQQRAAVAEQRAAGAEALAAERLARVDDLRFSLRMLEVGSRPPVDDRPFERRDDQEGASAATESSPPSDNLSSSAQAMRQRFTRLSGRFRRR